MQVEIFLKNNPRFEVTTTYFKVSEHFSTVISFYNYYQEIFPAADTPVTLHFFLFSSEGAQIAHHEEELGAGSFLQKDLREICGTNHREGMVGVAAIPNFNLEDLAREKTPLRPKISTGFYVTWFDDKDHVDIMHEWNPISLVPVKEKKSFLSYEFHEGKINPYVVLMNTTLGNQESALARPKLELYRTEKGKTEILSSFDLDPIPGMGTRVVDILNTLPEAKELFKKYKSLGLSVKSQNLPLPLTMEVHESGDFHIHHG
jgi:hypothetical protein